MALVDCLSRTLSTLVTALSKIGALKLDVDLKTLAMLLAPSIDSELGKRDAMEV